MQQITRNNYHLNPKSSVVYTPKEVSEFLYNLLSPLFPKKVGKPILDPCCGTGNLLAPWQSKGYPSYGVDIESESSADLVQDFLTWDGIDILQYQVKPQLVLCNPPFNGAYPQLAPEVWLDKIIELFGKDIPIVLFVPAGFRLNLTLESNRYNKFDQGKYPPISSIITLPKNIFAGVTFHSEILLFNIIGLEPHYFYNHHD